MRKVSTKQSAKNRELARIKANLDRACIICANEGHDLAHLLPKSTYPEHYTEPLNLVIMCRSCHVNYDNDLEFRQKQINLYDLICRYDTLGANKYFQLW